LGWKPAKDKPYKWMRYTEAGEYAQQLGSAFIEFGLEPSKETFIGIFARNRVEWVLTQLACDHYSFVNVPLYDTLGAEAISFILVQSIISIFLKFFKRIFNF
jgi:long-chain acyl-CoA synthetase